MSDIASTKPSTDPEPDAPVKDSPPTVPKVGTLEMEPGDSGKFKGQTIGIDVDKLEAYINSLKWKIRKDGHTKIIVDQVRQIQKDFEVEMRKMEKDPDVLTFDKEAVYEKATKAMLELALEGFNYEEAANHVDAGPGALGILSNEVRSFLVDLGGRVGQKHLQMLSKLATQNISPGSKT